MYHPQSPHNLLPLEWLRRASWQHCFCLRALFGWEWSVLIHLPRDVYLAPITSQALLPAFPTRDCMSVAGTKKRLS